jgi:hypothetical protein
MGCPCCLDQGTKNGQLLSALSFRSWGGLWLDPAVVVWTWKTSRIGALAITGSIKGERLLKPVGAGT